MILKEDVGILEDIHFTNDIKDLIDSIKILFQET